MDFKEQIKNFIDGNASVFGFDKINSIKISVCGMGENNVNYLAVINNIRFVFRIALKPPIEENVINEYNILKVLPKDVAPVPIYYDNSKKYLSKTFMIQSYVTGKPIKNWSNDIIRLHAQKIAKLHSQTSKSSTFFGNEFSIYKRLLKELKSYASDGTLGKNDKEVEALSKKIKVLFKEKDYLFTELSRFSRIHADLTIGNIFVNKGELHYIDWEWSRFDDNAFDIAKLYYTDVKLLDWALKLNNAQENLLLDTYLKALPFSDKTLRERVHLWQTYIMFTDYIYFKWKLNNYKKTENKLSKQYYQKTVKIMSDCLRRKFL